MERFLVTGGQGFIGAWVARRLLAEGASFMLLDLEPEDSILTQVLPREALPRLERCYADIGDARALREAVERARPTRIIHLAGLQVPSCRADPPRGARVNVLGTLNVFEAARALEPRPSLVYASSAAVAGAASDYGESIADEAPHRPRTHYGVFKLAGELGARVYFLDHGFPSVGLRPLVVYGVGREIGLTSGPTKAIKAAILGRPYRIGFSGLTGFSYADDVAALFIACARSEPRAALALNLPGEVAAVEDFVEALAAEIPVARDRVRVEGEPLPIAFRFSGEGLRALLGPSGVPATPLREGIRATAEIFRRLLREGRLPTADLRS